jgi:hypothetical protein
MAFSVCYIVTGIIPTGWTVRGSNPEGGGGEYSAAFQTGPEAHPDAYTIGSLSFRG